MAFQRLIRAALTRAKFVLYGDGEQRRDFTYVQDVARAFLLAAKSSVDSRLISTLFGVRQISKNIEGKRRHECRRGTQECVRHGVVG